MPDTVFYNNLKHCAELVKQAEVQCDMCMNVLTQLMEQAAHMFTSVEDVPPVEAEENTQLSFNLAIHTDDSDPLPPDHTFAPVIHYPDQPEVTGVVRVNYE